MSLARISHRNAALGEDPTGSIVKTAPPALDVPQTDAAAEFFAVWQEAARSLGSSGQRGPALH